MKNFDDSTIKAEIDQISRKIDTILRKVARVEPDPGTPADDRADPPPPADSHSER